MAGILEIRRGVSGISLQDGEFYLNKGLSAIQIGSGSSVLTILPLNVQVTGDIILDGNIYANNFSGSGVLGYQITANVTVGGVDSGTTFPIGTPHDDIFKAILTRFTNAAVSNFVVSNGVTPVSTSPRDLGDGFDYNRFTFSATQDSDGNYPTSASISVFGSNGGDETFDYLTDAIIGSNTKNVTPLRSVNRTTPGEIVFTLQTKKPDGSQNLTSLTYSIPYRLRNYLAASATSITTNADAQAVINSEVVASTLTSGRAWAPTCNIDNNDPTKYTYIIYPSSYGALTSVLQGAFNMLQDAFNYKGQFNIIVSGMTNSYRIYQSTQPGAYSAGVVLTIS